jgi:hypothetical protein
VKTGLRQQLSLSFGGALAATFHTPDAVNACTVVSKRTELDCELVLRGSPYRLDLRISRYSGPGTFNASAGPGSPAAVTLLQFDQSRNLAAEFVASSGQIVIQRGKVDAGPVLARNAGAAGSIDATLDPTFHAQGTGTPVNGPIHVSGTFACPLSGGGS